MFGGAPWTPGSHLINSQPPHAAGGPPAGRGQRGDGGRLRSRDSSTPSRLLSIPLAGQLAEGAAPLKWRGVHQSCGRGGSPPAGPAGGAAGGGHRHWSCRCADGRGARALSRGVKETFNLLTIDFRVLHMVRVK